MIFDCGRSQDSKTQVRYQHLSRMEMRTMLYDERKYEVSGIRAVDRIPQEIAGRIIVAALLVAGMTAASLAAPEAGQKTFSSAGEASKALVSAAEANDETALLNILGKDAKDVVNSGDPVEDRNSREEFVQKYRQMHRLVTEPDGTTTLYIGAENWPTPIPLMHSGKEWYFDTAAGKKEILYRRVGKNELAVIQVCRELVDAEKEYYAQPHDGNSGNQYARKLMSDPGKKNGLYWQTSAGEAQSPMGPLVASAAAEGYSSDSGRAPVPFQGYYFRVLTGQQSGSYIVNGKMTRGFAFVAYPAEYRSTGVMTFIVDQDGVVYEKDLGPHTKQIAKSMTRYARDASWRKAD
jgi:hypothetical protein